MVYYGSRGHLSGALFTPPPYRPHVVHIIKQSDETRGPTTPVPVTADSELAADLRPLTIYMLRSELFFTGQMNSAVLRLICTSAVDFAAIAYHRKVADNSTEVWQTSSGGDHQGHFLDTTSFNAPSDLNCVQKGAHRAMGVIKTGSTGGTFSVSWGGGNNARTMVAGSFLYLQEQRAY